MTEAAAVQRLRVTYRHGAALRFVSHLDLLRALERALRRARLPLAYSQGFNPHPRITSAAPLPVGFSGAAEIVDILLATPVELADFGRRLGAQLPPGLEILAVVDVPRALPALNGLLQAAGYRAWLPGDVEPAALAGAVERLLQRERIERPRRGRGKGSYDLRPLVLSLEVGKRDGQSVLDMWLAARAGATGRPEEVLDALGLVRPALLIERTALRFAEEPAASVPDEGGQP